MIDLWLIKADQLEIGVKTNAICVMTYFSIMGSKYTIYIISFIDQTIEIQINLLDK